MWNINNEIYKDGTIVQQWHVFPSMPKTPDLFCQVGKNIKNQTKIMLHISLQTLWYIQCLIICIFSLHNNLVTAPFSIKAWGERHRGRYSSQLVTNQESDILMLFLTSQYPLPALGLQLPSAPFPLYLLCPGEPFPDACSLCALQLLPRYIVNFPSFSVSRCSQGTKLLSLPWHSIQQMTRLSTVVASHPFDLKRKDFPTGYSSWWCN